MLPDHDGKLQERLKARPDHLKNVRPSVTAGGVLIGGAMLTKHPEANETPSMTGSVFLMTADSEEELRRILAEDVYATSGVWDLKGMKIWPFKTAVRHGAADGEKAWG